MTDRLMTLHPEGKAGVNISREKYELVKKAILDTLRAQGESPFQQLPEAVEKRLPADFDGSVGWYTTTVKLDLEARGLIERLPGRSPQHLRLTGQPG